LPRDDSRDRRLGSRRSSCGNGRGGREIGRDAREGVIIRCLYSVGRSTRWDTVDIDLARALVYVERNLQAVPSQHGLLNRAHMALLSEGRGRVDVRALLD